MRNIGYTFACSNRPAAVGGVIQVSYAQLALPAQQVPGRFVGRQRQRAAHFVGAVVNRGVCTTGHAHAGINVAGSRFVGCRIAQTPQLIRARNGGRELRPGDGEATIVNAFGGKKG